jgi:hypothetical protein
LLGGDRVGEVLELVEEFEEAVCVSFHVITFDRRRTGSQKRLFAPSAMVYTLNGHGRKAVRRGSRNPLWPGDPYYET